MDYTTLTESELLLVHSEVIDELHTRGVVRTGNNSLGDYTLQTTFYCRALP